MDYKSIQQYENYELPSSLLHIPGIQLNIICIVCSWFNLTFENKMVLKKAQISIPKTRPLDKLNCLRFKNVPCMKWKALSRRELQAQT